MNMFPNPPRPITAATTTANTHHSTRITISPHTIQYPLSIPTTISPPTTIHNTPPTATHHYHQPPPQPTINHHSTIRYTALTTHHSLLTTHYSPLTTHQSPLTTHHSPLTTASALEAWGNALKAVQAAHCTPSYPNGIRQLTLNTGPSDL